MLHHNAWVEIETDLDGHVGAVALAHDEGEVEGDVEGDQGGGQAGHQDGAAARQDGQDQCAGQRRACHRCLQACMMLLV